MLADPGQGGRAPACSPHGAARGAAAATLPPEHLHSPTKSAKHCALKLYPFRLVSARMYSLTCSSLTAGNSACTYLSIRTFGSLIPAVAVLVCCADQTIVAWRMSHPILEFGSVDRLRIISSSRPTASIYPFLAFTGPLPSPPPMATHAAPRTFRCS